MTTPVDTFPWQKKTIHKGGNQALYWFSACTVFLNTSSAYNIVSLESSCGIIPVFRNSMHHPRSSSQTTTTSNAYLLSIYSLFLSDSHASLHRKPSRCDATQLRRSQIHRPNCASQELSSSTPVTRHGHPCNPDNVYRDTSLVEAPT